MARSARKLRTAQDNLQPFPSLERVGVFGRIFVELAKGGGDTEEIMIDATHLKAHRTAASLLKKGLFPGSSDARKAG